MQFTELFKNSYIQTFDDNKARKNKIPPRTMPMSDYANNLRILTDLNDMGCGIYFTPNPCSGGRKEENVTSIEWVYCDIDGGNKPAQEERIKEAPVPPDMIVESKNGYHLYWKCRCDRTEFDRIIAGLINFFKADPAISSTNEVLRFPGFYHCKVDKNNVSGEPFKITIVREYLGQHHDVSELLTAYDVSTYVEDEIEAVKQIPVKAVLDKLGVQYRNNFIYENGEMTSASINERMNYVCRFSGKAGSGSTIDVAMNYGKMDKGAAIKWLKEHWSVKGNLVKKKEYKFLTMSDLYDSFLGYTEKNTLSKIIKLGIKEIDKEILGILPNTVMVISADTGVGKSQLAGNIVMNAMSIGKKVAYFDLENDETDWMSRQISRYVYLKTGKYCAPYSTTIKEIFEDRPEISEGLANTCDKYNNLFYLYNNKELLTIDRYVEAIGQVPDVDLVVLDHLHYFDFENERENESIGKIIRAIRMLSKQKGIPVIVVAHMRKRDKKREPDNEDIFGSSNIAKEATVVLLLSRYEGNKVRINITKSRGFGINKSWIADAVNGEYTNLIEMSDSGSELNFN